MCFEVYPSIKPNIEVIQDLRIQLTESRKTLRDEIAIAALTGILTWPILPTEKEDAVVKAYEYADMMLEVRNKEN